MSISLQILLSAALLTAIGIPALLQNRGDYRRLGQLSVPGLLLLILTWSLQGMTAALAIWQELTPTLATPGLQQVAGLLLMALGACICITGMVTFRTALRTIGLDTSRLVSTGIYRLTRNPQYVGYGLIQVGAVIAWWNGMAWVALATYIPLAYGTVLTEEEELLRLFGDEYRAYCRRTPRFLGRLR